MGRAKIRLIVSAMLIGFVTQINPDIGDSESRLGFYGERSTRRCADNARIKKIEREK